MPVRFGFIIAFISITIFTTYAHALQFFGPKNAPHTSTDSADSSQTSSSESERPGTSRSTPNLEILKAQKALQDLRNRPKEFRILVLGVQIFLGRFGYGTGPYTGVFDEKTREALKAYQTYVGLKPTGEIDYYTLEKLTNDNKALDQFLPFLPALKVQTDNWEEKVFAQGTWTLKGKDTSLTPRTTTITCSRTWNRCVETTAAIANTHTPYLSLKTHVHEIGTWDDKKIFTRPNSSETCTSAIIRIHRKQKTVTRLLSLQRDDDSCKDMENRDLHYRLGDGSAIYWSLKQRKAELTKKILRVKE